ncbi:MAG: Fic family protein [bacterium]|nr:Fic family protein [bacterium]
MAQNIHTFSLSLTMKLMNEISKVDRFDASWDIIEKREGQTLKQLKSIATVRSVGASTRIEGSKMTDAEVQVLIDKLKVSKLEERDQQEVAGYYEALDTIGESYRDIEMTEGNIKNLHTILMKYCDKDAWHKGGYKQVSNAVEANHPDGSKQIVFKTAEPGFETEEAMRKLFEWYHSDSDTLPIIKSALFVYEFLSIHPFQDGNGRLSRLLGTLLLLKHGYTWIQYVSFEHEIENRKAEYYKVLMTTQKQRPGEKVDEWIIFFLDCMMNIQEQLMEKLKTKGTAAQLGPKEKTILAVIENNPGIKSGEIAEKLDMSSSTVKKILSSMVKRRLVLMSGAGAGTNYIIELGTPIKKDLMFQLSNENINKGYTLRSPSNFLEIKKIILLPKFEWHKPDEWSRKMLDQALGFVIRISTSKGELIEKRYSLLAFNDPFLFQPVFALSNPINIPLGVADAAPKINEFPMRIVIELTSSVKKIDFDIMFVYDSVID